MQTTRTEKQNTDAVRGAQKIVRRTVAGAAVAALLAAPALAGAKARSGQPGNERLTKLERSYLEVRREFVDEFSVKDAGRNLVRWGQQEQDGDVRPAKPAELEESVSYMRGQLDPPSAAPSMETATETTSGYDTAGAPTSVVQCESGGDYGAVNPAGYYGAYQFDQGTWDAYAPEGYAGSNPASAPPEVQDAAAAAVPYDAWPNC